ncbi:MAG: cytochrome c oxidase subunit 3, partial [Phycisphaeraceae bacterium]
LFCAYAVYRANNPDVFLYAHHSLNTKLGAINTVVLLASSFTMAWGVRAAQLGQKPLLVVMLALTFLGGCGFMGIKTVEYMDKWEHAHWVGPWNEYHPDHQADESHAEADFGPDAPPENGVLPEDHPAEGSSEAEAAPGMVDQSPAPTGVEQPDRATETAPAPQPDAVAARSPAEPALPQDRVSLIRPAANAPAGLRTEVVAGDDVPVAEAPYPSRETMTPLDRDRTHIFYQIYYLMTGLHGLHVLIGMGLIAWIGVRAFAGHFGPAYYTPVDLVGLYWHLVDLIWIFLFPLLYLIH